MLGLFEKQEPLFMTHLEAPSQAFCIYLKMQLQHLLRVMQSVVARPLSTYHSQYWRDLLIVLYEKQMMKTDSKT